MLAGEVEVPVAEGAGDHPNMPEARNVTFITDYVGLHQRRHFPGKMAAILSQYYTGITLKEVKKACQKGSSS